MRLRLTRGITASATRHCDRDILRNLLLMVFNLIPLGPLDGHYILPHFLPDGLAATYRQFNAQYGHYLFLGLVVISIMGVPIFRYVSRISEGLVPLITFIR